MKISQITDILDNYAPRFLAEDYDNVGLLVGDGSRECKKILLCLDVDEIVAEEAVRMGADLIISHHPIMFSAIKKITADTSEGRCILKLIKNDVALYSAHTNLDSTSGGLNDLMCEILEIKNVTPLTNPEEDFGIGRVGELQKEVTLAEFAKKVKSAFAIDNIRFSGNPEKVIKTVALCSGGGGSLVYDAVASGADVYISGDLKYNNVRDLFFSGMGFIEVPHYKSEILAPKLFAKILDGCAQLYISKCNLDIFQTL